jgi:hypothetical protein
MQRNVVAIRRARNDRMTVNMGISSQLAGHKANNPIGTEIPDSRFSVGNKQKLSIKYQLF